MSRRDEVRIARVPLDKVMFHPHNVRRDLGDLRALTASIREFGILQPIVVEHYGDVLRLRIGHRRVASARLAGLTHAPAVIHAQPLDDDEFLLQALHENVMRRGLDEGERRHTVLALLEAGHTIAGIADSLGISYTTVHAWSVAHTQRNPKNRQKRVNITTLRRLVEDWRDRLEQGLSAADSRALLAALLEVAPPIDNGGRRRAGVSWQRSRHAQVDEINVQRGVDGHLDLTDLTFAEREEVIRRLAGDGRSDYAIAKTLRTTPETARRYRVRLGIPSNSTPSRKASA